MNTTDSHPTEPGAADPQAAAAVALGAALLSARTALQDSGFTARDQYTSAGSARNRTHHLDASCVRLRASRPVTVSWTENDLRLILPDATRRPARTVCVCCQSGSGRSYAQLLAQLLWAAVRQGEQLHIAAFGPGAPESYTLIDDDSPAGQRDVNFVTLHEHMAAVERLTFGVSQLFAAAARPSQVDDLAGPLAACVAVTQRSRALFAAVSSAAAATLAAPQLAKLAAASASLVTGAYSMNVNRRGRDVPSLVAHQHPGHVELHRRVQDVFVGWVKYCSDHPDRAPHGWRPDGAVLADLAGMEPTVDALSSVAVWHTPPDKALTPWELLMQNWQHDALSDLNILLADWCEHYLWVTGAPESSSFVVVSDERDAKLSNLHLSDRFDLLETVLSRYAPQPSEHSTLWTALVPTAAARALDGYTSAAGLLQAASLEGLDPARLDEALTLTISFRETFPEGAWLSASAQAAAVCLA